MNEQIDSSIPVLTEIIYATHGAAIPAAPEASASTSTMNHVPNADAVKDQTKLEQTKVEQTKVEQTKSVSIKEEKVTSTEEKVKEVISSEEKTEIEVEAESNLSNEAWLQLERNLHEKVLKQVLSRVEFVLEHRVRDSLADVLQGAVDTLAEDIRVGLKNSLEEVISRAVAQELAKAKLHR
ncbi:MAG: hypothetical protein K2P84_09935 [Undibacterium sp.]|nr:hypothetical protein [Undibacterium sp.]